MQFVAFERNKQGTGASRRLRNTGRAPGIVFGGSTAPVTIEVDHNALWHALKKEAFHASILDMELAGKVEKVLLRDVQYHPFKQQVLHIDFQRVDEKTRLHKKVPLHFVGAENSPAVKTDKCLVVHVATEVEIQCLASQLPEFLTIDLANVVKGQTLHVDDLQLGANIKVKVLKSTISDIIPPVGAAAKAVVTAGFRCAPEMRPATKTATPTFYWLPAGLAELLQAGNQASATRLQSPHPLVGNWRPFSSQSRCGIWLPAGFRNQESSSILVNTGFAIWFVRKTFFNTPNAV